MTRKKEGIIMALSSKQLNENIILKKGVRIMPYDYSKLNGRIVEKCGTQANFAEMMGLSERTISLKLNNVSSTEKNRER